jgi:DHA1 family bicyclomycin/chloramphenicol resistance-like MFS transporter
MTAQIRAALDKPGRKQSGEFTLALITGLTALGSVSVSIYLPSLPNIGTSHHAPPEIVKLSLSVFLFVFAASQAAYGPLSDRFGRRPPILCGAVIYLLGTAGCALAGTATALLLARAIQAVGAAAVPALGGAMLRDYVA